MNKAEIDRRKAIQINRDKEYADKLAKAKARDAAWRESATPEELAERDRLNSIAHIMFR